MPDGQNALVGITAQRKVRGNRAGPENTVRAQQNIPRGVLLNQSALVSGKQNGNRVGHQQYPGGHVTAKAKQCFLPDTGAGKVDVLDDVVQRDMGAEAEGSSQRRRPQPGKRGHRMFLGRESGEHQVEPDHIGFQFTYRPQETDRRRQIVKFPAADHIEPREFGLRPGAERFAILVGGKLIVGQFICQDDQFDRRIALEFARNVKSVLVQLTAARGKSCNQTDSHGGVVSKNRRLKKSKQGDAHKRSELLVISSTEIEKGLLL